MTGANHVIASTLLSQYDVNSRALSIFITGFLVKSSPELNAYDCMEKSTNQVLIIKRFSRPNQSKSLHRNKDNDNIVKV